MNLYRREIGVACFSYSVVHLWCFIVKRDSLIETLKFIFYPALISVFLVAFPIFFLLTITSNNASIKKWDF
jgi:DMSO/TMAO reductase YedYZ heme-binding membrane subunit